MYELTEEWIELIEARLSGETNDSGWNKLVIEHGLQLGIALMEERDLRTAMTRLPRPMMPGSVTRSILRRTSGLALEDETRLFRAPSFKSSSSESPATESQISDFEVITALPTDEDDINASRILDIDFVNADHVPAGFREPGKALEPDSERFEVTVRHDVALDPDTDTIKAPDHIDTEEHLPSDAPATAIGMGVEAISDAITRPQEAGDPGIETLLPADFDTSDAESDSELVPSVATVPLIDAAEYDDLDTEVLRDHRPRPVLANAGAIRKRRRNLVPLAWLGGLAAAIIISIILSLLFLPKQEEPDREPGSSTGLGEMADATTTPSAHDERTSTDAGTSSILTVPADMLTRPAKRSVETLPAIPEDLPDNAVVGDFAADPAAPPPMPSAPATATAPPGGIPGAGTGPDAGKTDGFLKGLTLDGTTRPVEAPVVRQPPPPAAFMGTPPPAAVTQPATTAVPEEDLATRKVRADSQEPRRGAKHQDRARAAPPTLPPVPVEGAPETALVPAESPVGKPVAAAQAQTTQPGEKDTTDKVTPSADPKQDDVAKGPIIPDNAVPMRALSDEARDKFGAGRPVAPEELGPVVTTVPPGVNLTCMVMPDLADWHRLLIGVRNDGEQSLIVRRRTLFVEGLDASRNNVCQFVLDVQEDFVVSPGGRHDLTVLMPTGMIPEKRVRFLRILLGPERSRVVRWPPVSRFEVEASSFEAAP